MPPSSSFDARVTGPAGALLAALVDAEETVGTAESITGGLLGAALTEAPGSSEAYRGGVIAYATDLKIQLLGVDPSLLAAHGVISAACAEAMAEGARVRTGSTYGLATTGVAGPSEQEGQPPGTVYVGLAGPAGTRAVSLWLEGDREEIRHRTVAEALSALGEQVVERRTGRLGEESLLG